ncbi:hypothetical protein SUDANB32_05906 [Streptomyces sp. enrichment culture]
MVFNRLRISSGNLSDRRPLETLGPRRTGCVRRGPRGSERHVLPGQVKFTSLHRKYVWSECEACQIV